MIAELLNSVRDGVSNPLQVYIQLKGLEKELEVAIKEISDLAISEAEKWKEKRFTAYGAEVEKKNGPSRYVYDHIPQWQALREKIKAIEEISKVGKDFETGANVVDENGEIIPPATKIQGKAIISIKLKPCA